MNGQPHPRRPDADVGLMRGLMRGWWRIRLGELSSQHGRHRPVGTGGVDHYTVRQRQRGSHRVGQRLRVGLDHHGHPKPGRLDGFDQCRHPALRWQPDEELVGHRAVFGRFANNVQGDDVGPAPTDGRGERTQAAGLISDVDV
ncbi:MAG: hypothetical protein ACRDQU_18820 [Pseudonocardiaceae bacterium]